MNTINKNKAKELIKGSKGLIFAATFTKKDGTHRLMNARIGKKYTPTGRKQPYKPEDYNLISLYDMKIKAFRMLNLKTLITLSINKEKYLIEQSEESHFTFDSEGNNIII
tara:strand:+ start:1617 stop:1946 length:330 start_codon:yes stop_codon:yes gene_type:complete